MGKLIMGILFKLRGGLNAVFQKLFSRMKDPKSGKVGKPKDLMMIFWVCGVIAFAVIVGTQMFSKTRTLKGGGDEFRKELTPKIGINDQPGEAGFDSDPLGEALRLNKERQNQAKDSVGLQMGSIDKKDDAPSKDQCLALMDRMKKGEDLKGGDKEKMNTCLDKNIGGWTDDQRQFANALLNDNSLSPEEKDLLRKGINGTLTPEEYKLAKALSGKDEAAKAIAREAIRSGALKDEPVKSAFANAIMGKDMATDQRSMVGDIIKDAAETAKKPEKEMWDKLSEMAKGATDGLNGSGLNGAATSNGKDGQGGNGINGMSAEQLQALAKEMAAKEAELLRAQQALAEAQAAAQLAGKNLAAGRALTPEEQAAIAKLAALQKQVADLERAQKERRIKVIRAASSLQKSLASVAMTIDETVPSGFSVAYEDAPILDCKKIAAIASHVPRVRTNKNATSTILGLDGKPLKPDIVKLISLRRKNMMELDRQRDHLMNPSGANGAFTKGSENIDAATLFGQNGQNGAQQLDMNSLAVFQDKSLKSFTLSPNMKIPVVLLSTIFVSSKGKSQIVRAKILDDVVNPENNQLAIPKGSIVVGSTSNFDNDTGIMDLSFDKVSVGSGKVLSLKFSVGSADGSMGLKGEIHDTRGKYLLGAFVTAFSSGALNWFSQQVVQPYQAATDLPTALTGAGAGGAAEVMQKLANLTAGDLQNAATLFYVPKGVPFVLFPAE